MPYVSCLPDEYSPLCPGQFQRGYYVVSAAQQRQSFRDGFRRRRMDRVADEEQSTADDADTRREGLLQHSGGWSAEVSVAVRPVELSVHRQSFGRRSQVGHRTGHGTLREVALQGQQQVFGHRQQRWPPESVHGQEWVGYEAPVVLCREVQCDATYRYPPLHGSPTTGASAL